LASRVSFVTRFDTCFFHFFIGDFSIERARPRRFSDIVSYETVIVSLHRRTNTVSLNIPAS